MVFALFSLFANVFNMSSRLFFRVYVIVPLCTLLTALFVWPNDILPDPSTRQQRKRRPSYVGAGSPYLSPAMVNVHQSPLVDAPLRTVLTHKPFYCLAIWVSIHVLKLNFVVASINDQLELSSMPDDQTSLLIHIFGAMLPFGFVVLPLVAYLLAKSTLICFQVANTVGLLYGAVLAFFPDQALYYVLIVFPAVATSRQLVYSTVFHQTGELFGFLNYGVILGLINVLVSAMSLVQGPLVEWSEGLGDYFSANILLLLLTVPLFCLVYGTVPKTTSGNEDGGVNMTEESPLLLPTVKRSRAMSDGVTWSPSM